MKEDPREIENIAQTLARELPKAEVLMTHASDFGLVHVAVPQGTKIETIDLEKYLDAPRRTQAVATFSDSASFIDYTNHHRRSATTVWCGFNPQSFDLGFVGVIDEIPMSEAAWRSHQAKFAPAMSAEWKAWNGANKSDMAQVNFAEWLENHEDDIAEANGLPTLLQLKQMVSNFYARQDMSFKSVIRLQDGSVNMQFAQQSDDATVEAMRVYERFCIGIPVFHGDKDENGKTKIWQITARLKYRVSSGKVLFRYELVRPDRVHEAASLEMIQTIKGGVVDIPLRMGSCVG